MKMTIGRPYQLPSGRWYVYVECPDGKLRRFSCRQASPVFEVYMNPNTRRFPRRQIKGRFDVLARDNYTCQYCGRQAPDVVLHVDHKVPIAKGGTDDPDNLLTACADCNQGKWTRHPGGIVDPVLHETMEDRKRAAMNLLHEAFTRPDGKSNG